MVTVTIKFQNKIKLRIQYAHFLLLIPLASIKLAQGGFMPPTRCTVYNTLLVNPILFYTVYLAYALLKYTFSQYFQGNNLILSLIVSVIYFAWI